MIAQTAKCKICAAKLTRRRYEKGLCAQCDPLVPPRLEHIVRRLLLPLVALFPTMQDDTLIGGRGSDKTRPDLCWVTDDRILHVEVDEDSHADRDPSCELKKLDSANWGFLDHKPTFVLRFNCSACDSKRVTLEDRVATLATIINRLLTGPLDDWDSLRVNVCLLFYLSSANHHIKAARACPMSIKVHDEEIIFAGLSAEADGSKRATRGFLRVQNLQEPVADDVGGGGKSGGGTLRERIAGKAKVNSPPLYAPNAKGALPPAPTYRRLRRLS